MNGALVIGRVVSLEDGKPTISPYLGGPRASLGDLVHLAAKAYVDALDSRDEATIGARLDELKAAVRAFG